MDQQKSEGKLAGRYAEVDDEEMPAKKKRRIAPRQERPKVLAQFRAADTSSVKKVITCNFQKNTIESTLSKKLCSIPFYDSTY